MNTDDVEKPNSNVECATEPVISGKSGFLILGLITGLALGYVEAFGIGQFLGYTNRFHHAWQHFYYLLNCLVVGGLAGLLLGYMLDALIRGLRRRRHAIYLWIWLLVIGFIAAVLLLPAVQMVR